MTATYANHRCAVCRVVIQKHLRLCDQCEADLKQVPTQPPVIAADPLSTTHAPYQAEPTKATSDTEVAVTTFPLVEDPKPVTQVEVAQTNGDTCPHGRSWLEDCVQCGRVVAVEPQPEANAQQ